MKKQTDKRTNPCTDDPRFISWDILFRLKSTLIIFIISFMCLPGIAQITAGVAQIDITPEPGGPMYGYSARGTNVSKGVHDNLYARALVLNDGSTKLVIVTVDIGAIRKENSERIKRMIQERTNIENILLVASHTHSGPAQCSGDIEEKIADVVVRANSNPKSARIGVGLGEVREGHNRRMIHADGSLEMFWENRTGIPTSPVDYRLGVIRIEGSNGPIATLVNFTCHPVVAGPENLLFSADYPGAMNRILKEKIGGQIMYLPGASGDINPFWDKTPPDEGAFDQIERMGKALADEVVNVSEHIVDYDEKPVISFKREISQFATRRDTARLDKSIQAEINMLLIGNNLALAMFPGEFFVEHGLSLKERSPFKYTFFVGYCNDQLAYFPTISSTLTGGYGAASATQVEIGAGEYLVNRALINLMYQGNKISGR